MKAVYHSIYEPVFDDAVRLRDAGDTEGAIARMTEFAKLEPAAPAAYAVLGDLYWKLERYEESASNFRRGAELQPRAWQFSHGLFHMLLKLGRVAEAIAEAKRYLAIVDSNDPPKNRFPDIQMYRDWVATDPSEYEDLLRGLNEER